MKCCRDAPAYKCCSSDDRKHVCLAEIPTKVTWNNCLPYLATLSICLTVTLLSVPSLWPFADSLFSLYLKLLHCFAQSSLSIEFSNSPWGITPVPSAPPLVDQLSTHHMVNHGTQAQSNLCSRLCDTLCATSVVLRRVSPGTRRCKWIASALIWCTSHGRTQRCCRTGLSLENSNRKCY